MKESRKHITNKTTKISQEPSHKTSDLVKKTILVAVASLGLCVMIGVFYPKIFYDYASLQNERLRHNQSEAVQMTQSALMEKGEYLIPKELERAITKIGPGSGLMTELIFSPSDNTTIAIVVIADHVNDHLDPSSVVITNNQKQDYYQTTMIGWSQYRDTDFALGALEINGNIVPSDTFSPYDSSKLVPPSATDIYVNPATSYGFAALPGPDLTLIPSYDLAVSTVTNLSFQNDGTILGFGKYAPNMSGGPVVSLDGYVIGVNTQFKWNKNSLANPQSDVFIIAPIPNDFFIFYTDFINDIKSQKGIK